ncbi:hypothetical protein LZ31DRAFT_48987 [Colletotrichum somersetense]|nr:hypothetical protein LZ31DRAFT_48987 [Colletotrichum somersetense]
MYEGEEGRTPEQQQQQQKRKRKKKRRKKGPLITQCRLADGTILAPVHPPPSSPDSYPVGRGLGLDPREPAFIDKSQIWGKQRHSIHPPPPPLLYHAFITRASAEAAAGPPMPLLIRLNPTPGSPCQLVFGMPIEGRVVASPLPGMA